MAKAVTQAFLLCDEVRTVGGKRSFLGVFDSLRAGPARFHIVFRFVTGEGSHEVRLRMKTPAGEVPLYAGEVTCNHIHTHIHAIEQDLESGKYMFTAHVDGRLMGVYELEVR